MTATFARTFLAGVALATVGAAVASGAFGEAAVAVRAWRHRPRRTCRGCPCGAMA